MAPHHTPDLAPLLRYESSALEQGALTSIAEYASRMKEGQSEVYVLCCPTRALCEASPYVESFKRAQVEVLYVPPLPVFINNCVARCITPPLQLHLHSLRRASALAHARYRRQSHQAHRPRCAA